MKITATLGKPTTLAEIPIHSLFTFDQSTAHELADKCGHLPQEFDRVTFVKASDNAHQILCMSINSIEAASNLRECFPENTIVIPIHLLVV